MLENYKPYPDDCTMIHVDGEAHKRFVAVPANITKSGVIFLGVRHGCPLMNASIRVHAALTGQSAGRGMKQGFVDQHGTFMDRKEAMIVAVVRCQIKRSIGYDSDELYSEHLH